MKKSLYKAARPPSYQPYHRIPSPCGILMESAGLFVYNEDCIGNHMEA